MKTLAYLAGFYAATCVGSLAGFAALCVQAARRDRQQAQAEWDALEAEAAREIPAQRPATTEERLADVRALASIRVQVYGWADLAEWEMEMAHDRGRGER